MKQSSLHILLAAILILAAAFSRVILYPDNFSPIIGMALFAGAALKDKRMAFLFPILAMLASDIMFEVSGIAPGFWGWGQLIGYGILALITVMAFSLKKWNVVSIAGYSIGSSLIFFILSNLSFFLIDNRTYHTYTQDLSGLKQCYIMALPFLRSGLFADLVFSGILFGSFYLISRVVSTKNSIA